MRFFKDVLNTKAKIVAFSVLMIILVILLPIKQIATFLTTPYPEYTNHAITVDRVEVCGKDLCVWAKNFKARFILSGETIPMESLTTVMEAAKTGSCVVMQRSLFESYEPYDPSVGNMFTPEVYSSQSARPCR